MKPRNLSRARAQGLNNKEVGDFLYLYRNLRTELNVRDKLHLIFSMDATGFPCNNNFPPKTVNIKGVRECDRCCMLRCIWWIYSPFHYIKGGSLQENIQAGITAGSAIAMTDSDFINNGIFLQWLHHFQKQFSQGKWVLILVGNSLYSSYMCRKIGLEMFFLPPHRTHVLQHFDRTVFKPINTYYHQDTTKLIYNNSNAAITKFSFGKLSSITRKKHIVWKRCQRFWVYSRIFF